MYNTVANKQQKKTHPKQKTSSSVRHALQILTKHRNILETLTTQPNTERPKSMSLLPYVKLQKTFWKCTILSAKIWTIYVTLDHKNV